MIDPTRLVQIEINVSDLEISLRFYEHAFGWRRVPAEIHNYVVLEVPDHCPFGVALVPRPGKPATAPLPLLVPYFKVEDPEALIKKVEEFGGALVFGPKVLPSYGTIFQVADPDGQRFGLLK